MPTTTCRLAQLGDRAPRRQMMRVVMAPVTPTPDSTGVRVAAREDYTATGASWYAVAHASCA